MSATTRSSSGGDATSDVEMSRVSNSDVYAANNDTSASIRSNNNGRYNQSSFDHDINDEDLMKLSLHISAWTFWWKFAVWPLLFGIVNALVFGMLLQYDEYEYRMQRDIDSHPRSYENYVNTSYTYLAMLRYNNVIFAIMLTVDAVLLYIAANIVQRQVVALDNLTESAAGQRDNPNGHMNRDHVHGQVSRRLDAILGRRNCAATRNRSILISLLLLGSAACASFAAMSLVDWTFTWTHTAKTKCASSSVAYVRPTLPPRPFDADRSGANYVPGLPAELQQWAQQEYRRTSTIDPDVQVVQLLDGTIYFVTVEPPTPLAVKKAANNRGEGYISNERILAAMAHQNASSFAQLHFLSQVSRPRYFITWRTNDTDNNETTTARDDAYWHVPGFCCLFDEINRTDPTDTPYRRNDDEYTTSVESLLCADMSDSASLMTSTTPNIRTIALERRHLMEPGRRMSLSSSSLKWHNHTVWLRLVWYMDHGNLVEFFTISGLGGDAVPSSQSPQSPQSSLPPLPLELVSVANVTGRFNHNFFNMDDPTALGIVDGEPRACQEWRTSIQYWSLAVGCAAATTWLARFVPNHGASVAVAPAFMAMATFLLAMDAGELSDWLCLLTAATTFLTLLGCGLSMGPLVRRCGGKDTDIHEALVWLLYTSLAATAMIGDADMLEVRFGFGLGASIVAGTLLGHPALYLVGWFGGIGLVVVGLFLSVVYQEEWNYEWHYIVLIAVGVFGGAGCIAVGRLLITYRAYLRYYSMRAWHAVKSAGAQAANRGTQMSADTNSQEGSFLTDGLLRNSNE